MDQETLSEKKTLFFQKVNLQSSEILVFDFVLVFVLKRNHSAHHNSSITSMEFMGFFISSFDYS